MTWHKIIFGDSRDMSEIPSGSVHLVVTSPPYYNAFAGFTGKNKFKESSSESIIILLPFL